MIPIKYAIEYEWVTFISARRQKDKTIKWVVEEIGTVMDKNTGKFEYEPMPSSRTDEFLERTRFDSAEEAHNAYKKFYPEDNLDGPATKELHP